MCLLQRFDDFASNCRPARERAQPSGMLAMEDGEGPARGGMGAGGRVFCEPLSC